MEEGSIVLAPFWFSETEDRKVRPALVFSTTAISVGLVFITSKKVDKAFTTEVALSQEEAEKIGLRTASRIDFGKRIRIPRYEVIKVLGHISSLPKRKLAECFEAAKTAHLFD